MTRNTEKYVWLVFETNPFKKTTSCPFYTVYLCTSNMQTVSNLQERRRRMCWSRVFEIINFFRVLSTAKYFDGLKLMALILRWTTSFFLSTLPVIPFFSSKLTHFIHPFLIFSLHFTHLLMCKFWKLRRTAAAFMKSHNNYIYAFATVSWCPSNNSKKFWKFLCGKQPSIEYMVTWRKTIERRY